MSRTIRKTKSTKRTKPGPVITWKHDKLLDVRRALAHVQAKLNSFGSLAARLAIEAPQVTQLDLLNRLRTRRTVLAKQLAELQKSTYDAGTKRVQTRLVTQPPPPPGYSGWAEPYISDAFSPDGVADNPRFFVCLNHGSSCEYSRSFKDYLSAGYILETVSVNAHASPWYEDDEPDYYEVGQFVRWLFPVSSVDTIINCDLVLELTAVATIAADGGGQCQIGVATANTDEDGNWPHSVPLSTAAWLPFDKSGGINTYFPFSFVLTTKANKTPGISLGLFTLVWAQDGTASLDAEWDFEQLLPTGTYAGPPYPLYKIRPRNLPFPPQVGGVTLGEAFPPSAYPRRFFVR